MYDTFDNTNTCLQSSRVCFTSKRQACDSTFSAMSSIEHSVNRYISGLALIMWPYARLATRATLPLHPHVG